MKQQDLDLLYERLNVVIKHPKKAKPITYGELVQLRKMVREYDSMANALDFSGLINSEIPDERHDFKETIRMIRDRVNYVLGKIGWERFK